MKYRFKPLDELYWGVLTAALLVLLPALVTLEPEKITSWQTWAVALGGGALRAAAGAALDYVRRSITQDEPSEAPAPIPPVDTEALIEHIREQVKADLEAARLARVRPIEDARRPRPTLVTRSAEWVEGEAGRG